MHFLRPNEEGLTEVLDVRISVPSHIDKISIQNVKIKGKLFEYELLPSSNVNSMHGLMLLELILLDVEKFVDKNTQKHKIIY